MAFTDSKLARIGLNACLVAASVAATLFVIEIGLRLATNFQEDSRYDYWRQATYASFFYHYIAERPAELVEHLNVDLDRQPLRVDQHAVAVEDH